MYGCTYLEFLLFKEINIGKTLKTILKLPLHFL